MSLHPPIESSGLPGDAAEASNDFDGQDWSTLFLLLDALLDLPTAPARDALLAEVARHAPFHAQALRHLLALHLKLERTAFLQDGPGALGR